MKDLDIGALGSRLRPLFDRGSGLQGRWEVQARAAPEIFFPVPAQALACARQATAASGGYHTNLDVTPSSATQREVGCTQVRVERRVLKRERRKACR